MIRLLAAATMALVLLASAFPAFADPLDTAAAGGNLPEVARDAVDAAPVDESDQDGAPVVCADDEGLEVIALGDDAPEVTSTLATPEFDGDGESAGSFLVDLGATSTDTVGAVEVTMTWQRRSNDFDLVATAAGAQARSEAYQPVERPAETLRLDVAHCGLVELTAVNFMAPADDDVLTLSFAVVDAEKAEAPDAAEEDDVAEAADAESGAQSLDEDAPATLAE